MLTPLALRLPLLASLLPPLCFAAVAQEPPEPDAEAGPRGVVVHEQGAFDGLTLYAPLAGTSVYLIDLEGTVVHNWELQDAGSSVYLLEDGHLLQCLEEPKNPRFRGGGLAGRMQILDKQGKAVWDWPFMSDYATQHHDVEPLPNGNLLFIAWEYLPREDALELGRDPAFLSGDGMWPDAVFEVRPVPPNDAEIVWEWHVQDHLIQDFDPDRSGYGSPADEAGKIDINADHRTQPPLTEKQREKRRALEERMKALGYAGGDEPEDEEDDKPDRGREQGPDWLHTNAVAYHPEHDLIALSTPHLGEIWIIDHSTSTEEAASSFGGRYDRGGDLLWRWGNPMTYGAGRTKDKRLFYQHDPKFIDGPDGALHLLVYNNGQERPAGDWSSVEELVLPFDPERGFLREKGKAYGPTEPLWSYSEPDDFYSAFISGSQRLPNGNTLICEGARGRLIEVNAAGERVWVYENVHGGDAPASDQAPSVPPKALFRATRLGYDHPGVKALGLGR